VDNKQEWRTAQRAIPTQGGGGQVAYRGFEETDWDCIFGESSDNKRNYMPAETFQASRWTKGNFLFPTVIEVTDKAVVRRKRSWFSRDEISMSIFTSRQA